MGNKQTKNVKLLIC